MIAAKCPNCNNFTNFCTCSFNWQEMKNMNTEKRPLLKVITFEDGYNSAKKEDRKIITDKLNAYKSKLSDCLNTKMSRRTPPKDIETLKARVELLEELKKII